MTTPKYHEGQPVLLFGCGLLPIPQTVISVIGWFEVGNAYQLPNGMFVHVEESTWVYRTEEWFSVERYLKPIEPDETEEESHDQQIKIAEEA